MKGPPTYFYHQENIIILKNWTQQTIYCDEYDLNAGPTSQMFL